MAGLKWIRLETTMFENPKLLYLKEDKQFKTIAAPGGTQPEGRAARNATTTTPGECLVPERSTYQFSCRQLFNQFGAPGIPNTYRATLFSDGRVIEKHDFWWRSKAEQQCFRWVVLYGATPIDQDA